MMKQIRDWKVQIIQFFFPLAVTIILLLEKQFFVGIIAEIDEPDIIFAVFRELGYWAIVLAIGITLYFIIGKRNKKEILKQNLNEIVWHSYFGYWLCRHILNYQIVSLTRVPIPVQFKLVWEGLFKKYDYLEGVYELESSDVILERYQDNPISSSVNLVLSDTYLIDWKRNLPADTLNYTSIVVINRTDNGVRVYNPRYVASIATAVHDLPKNVVEINIFATINSAHVYHITNEVFKTGGRDGIKRIRIFEQSKNSWTFDAKNKIEIKTGV